VNVIKASAVILALLAPVVNVNAQPLKCDTLDAILAQVHDKQGQDAVFIGDLPHERRLLITGNADDQGAYTLIEIDDDDPTAITACIVGTGYNARTEPMPHNGRPG
jgi:hypothetical protein